MIVYNQEEICHTNELKGVLEIRIQKKGDTIYISMNISDNLLSGFNNAPSGYRIDNEELPKGAMRILMGGKIQEQHRERKRQRTDASDNKEDKDVGSSLLHCVMIRLTDDLVEN